jgi:hypothetical protein
MRVIKEDKMGGACDVHGRDDVCTKFWLGGPKRRDHLENIGIDGRTVLK